MQRDKKREKRKRGEELEEEKVEERKTWGTVEGGREREKEKDRGIIQEVS